MKLLTLRFGASFRPGVLVGDEVLNLALAGEILPAAAALASSVKGLLEGGATSLASLEGVIEAAAEPGMAARLRGSGALSPLSGATLGPVVPDPDLVLSGSMNSRGHLEEMGDELPDHPCAFHKVRSALSASGADIRLPPGHGEKVDWEGEFCIVIGSPCHQVSVEAAMEHVVGYTLMNDVSAREYAVGFISATGAASTAQAWERNVLGKNYPTFAPVGPVIVTKDELPTPLTYTMRTLVNGVEMQFSTQDDLVFGPAEMVSYFSQFYVFAPGDIISMGSPPGVGMARKPPVFLKPGDLVEVCVDEIGALSNRVAAV